MSRIAVILPAYNEEKTVSATIEDFHNALPDAAIWVVNNRSVMLRNKRLKTPYSGYSAMVG